MSYRKFGWCPDVPDFRDFRMSVSINTDNLPTSVDLRAGMPDVWDQGDLGSCTGHAIAAVVQYEQRKVHPKWDFMPSRLFIYYNERAAEGTIDQDCGAMIRTGIKSVAGLGVCREDLWIYDVRAFKQKPTPAAYKNATLHHALLYQRVPQTENGIKSVLAQGHPFVFGFACYDSFEGEAVASTGMLTMPGRREKMIGGHAVTAVGYDPDHVLVRNSWGGRWGIGGYFKMPWAYILDSNLSDDLWAITRMQ